MDTGHSGQSPHKARLEGQNHRCTHWAGLPMATVSLLSTVACLAPQHPRRRGWGRLAARSTVLAGDSRCSVGAAPDPVTPHPEESGGFPSGQQQVSGKSGNRSERFIRVLTRMHAGFLRLR